MSGEDPIRLRGKILEIMPRGVFQLELPNRHRMLAYTPKRFRANVLEIVVGQEVTVEVSPFDFSVGKVVIEI